MTDRPIMMSARCVAALVVLAAAVPGAAEAQIYYWRDASGHLVLSDRPKDPAAREVSTARPPASLQTTSLASVRSAPFDPLIDEHAAAQGVDADLVRAVIRAESGFNPKALSHKGAMGLMQLMPATARDYGVQDPYDPAENIRAGVAHLKNLLVRYSNNVELALAAYNAGPGAVARYGSVPPYRETQDYVEKIQRAVETAPGPKDEIYLTIEIVNGRPIPKYTTRRSAGAEVVVPGRR